MGHGHHGEPYKIPDWRIYKVENAPKLLQTQKVLASLGLKDPWLRNEVWRYDKAFGSEAQRFKLTWTRGFKYGFAAFLVTIIGTEIYDRLNPSDHGHGDAGHH